jgi:hypothetical protein
VPACRRDPVTDGSPCLAARDDETQWPEQDQHEAADREHRMDHAVLSPVVNQARRQRLDPRLDPLRGGQCFEQVEKRVYPPQW